MMLHRLLLYVHVLAAFLYLLAHGGSVAVAYSVRRESNADRLRALLDLSRSTVAVANGLLMLMIACGIALGFLGHWWSATWLRLAIEILVLIFVVMARSAGPYFRRIRTAVGLVFDGGTWKHTGPDSSPEELARVLESGSANVITAVSVGGWAVILWLMLFKPF
jgi:hypothetical protein